MPAMFQMPRLGLMAVLLFASLYQVPDSTRLRSLTDKVKCDCGCSDVLSECPHKKCTRTPLLKKEIADAIAHGDTDQQILENFRAKHGTAMLVTPMFQGFNMLLWIVPVGAAVLALGLVVYRFRPLKQRLKAQ